MVPEGHMAEASLNWEGIIVEEVSVYQELQRSVFCDVRKVWDTGDSYWKSDSEASPRATQEILHLQR